MLFGWLPAKTNCVRSVRIELFINDAGKLSVISLLNVLVHYKTRDCHSWVYWAQVKNVRKISSNLLRWSNLIPINFLFLTILPAGENVMSILGKEVTFHIFHESAKQFLSIQSFTTWVSVDATTSVTGFGSYMKYHRHQ